MNEPTSTPFLALVLLALCLLWSGCATAESSAKVLQPWTWFRQAAAERVEKRENALEDKKSALVHQGHIESVKASLAANKVATTYPEDKNADLAKRAAANAVAALAQIDTVTVEELREAITIVEGWASAESAKRSAAEAAQIQAEKKTEQIANEANELRKQLETLREKATAEAAHNAQLANELRQAQWYKWGGLTLSALAGVAAVAYRMNLGRLQDGVAGGLAELQKKFGAKDEDLVQVNAAINAATSRGQQKALQALVGSYLVKST